MANARGKAVDKTYLSLDQAERRGFLHRDYIAHCFRWSHIVRHLYTGKRYATARILDIGCGEELPLMKLLHSSRLGPKEGCYVGIDAKKFTPEVKVNFPTAFFTGAQFPACDLGEHKAFNLVTCLEVLEHVEPSHGLTMLRGINDLLALTQGAEAFISTPCYDYEVGAADNHVSEYSYEAFKIMLQLAGLVVTNHWGTFASQRDYKPLLSPAQAEVFEALSSYYDQNIVSTIFAPLFPQASRNCLWQVKAGTPDRAGALAALKSLATPAEACSSTLWATFVQEVSCAA